ncbi:MAG TPA: prepilin peptidase, partial [Sphingomonas sp.]|nr:prepilin peptidase [Sphingomonas sp.]
MLIDAMRWAFILIVAAAAVQDIVTFRISNIFFLLLIALFGAWIVATGEYDILQNLAVFGVTLGIGTLLFARGWLGGGDVKLLAATALWFNFAQGLGLLAAITLGGGLLALLLVVARRMLPVSLYHRRRWPILQPKGPIPYGLAIAAGAIVASQMTGFHPSGDGYAPGTAQARQIAIQKERLGILRMPSR